jgi:hypothetical protein
MSARLVTCLFAPTADCYACPLRPKCCARQETRKMPRELTRYRVPIARVLFRPTWGNSNLAILDRQRLDTRRFRLAIDRYYIRYWSMRLDLALLIKADFPNPSRVTSVWKASANGATTARRDRASSLATHRYLVDLLALNQHCLAISFASG